MTRIKKIVTSHPSRVRELKPLNLGDIALEDQSHPSRVRELKLTDKALIASLIEVAPLPGA